MAALTMREVPRRLELHPDALRDPARSVAHAVSWRLYLKLESIRFMVEEKGICGGIIGDEVGERRVIGGAARGLPLNGRFRLPL